MANSLGFSGRPTPALGCCVEATRRRRPDRPGHARPEDANSSPRSPVTSLQFHFIAWLSPSPQRSPATLRSSSAPLRRRHCRPSSHHVPSPPPQKLHCVPTVAPRHIRSLAALGKAAAPRMDSPECPPPSSVTVAGTPPSAISLNHLCASLAVVCRCLGEP